MCRNLINHRFGFELEKLYHHYYFATGGCILFLKPSDFPRRHRSAGFCSQLGHVSRSCASNLCKPVAIMFHCSTSLFRPFSYPPTSKCIVSLWTSFFIYSLDMPQPPQPLFSQKFFNIFTPVMSGIFSLFIFLFFRAFPNIFYNVLISVVVNFLLSSYLNRLHSIQFILFI